MGEEIEQLRERLVRIETKIDLYIINGIQDHESRVRVLEKWKYGVPASMFTALASVAATVFVALGR